MGKTIAAGIFIVNEKNELLVCHPTNHKPDFWSIPKGKVEDGETTTQAAIRETFEETNIDLSEFTRLNSLDPVNYNHKKKMIYPYVCFEKENPNINWKSLDIKCNSNVPIERGGFPEMDDYKWVPIEEARKTLHYTQVACLDSVEKLMSNLNKSYLDIQ